MTTVIVFDKYCVLSGPELKSLSDYVVNGDQGEIFYLSNCNYSRFLTKKGNGCHEIYQKKGKRHESCTAKTASCQAYLQFVLQESFFIDHNIYSYSRKVVGEMCM